VPPEPACSPALLDLDGALMRIRRLWDTPAGVEHHGEVLDGSTLMVCLVLADAGAGAEPGVVEVATGLGVVQSTASRLVARATAAGMVQRTPSARDPRRAALGLTAAGVDLVRAARAHRARALGACLDGWSQADLEALAELMSRFADAVGGGLPVRPRRAGRASPS
jgi:DNA-binding MarR family transcriptional regulator